MTVLMSFHNLDKVGFISTGEHADGKAIYRNDLNVYDHPALFWFFRSSPSRTWERCDARPQWDPNREYLYKPPIDTVNATLASKLKDGETYWAPNPLAPSLVHEGIWMNSRQQQDWLSFGLIYLSKDAAFERTQRMLKS